MRSRATTLTGTAVRRIDLAPGRIQSQRLASIADDAQIVVS